MFDFDTDCELVTPAAGELLAELHLDIHSVRDVMEISP